MFRRLGMIFPLIGLTVLIAVLVAAAFATALPSLPPTAFAAIGVGIGVAVAHFGLKHRDFLALGLVLALALAMFGATPAAASETTVTVGPIYGLVEPYLRILADAAIAGLVGWAVALVKRWTGIQIEARHREALHSAAMTGVTQALARLGTRLDGMTVDVRSEVVASAIEWIEASVPDALAALGVTREKVEALATAKLGQLIAGAQSSPPPFDVGDFITAPGIAPA